MSPVGPLAGIKFGYDDSNSVRDEDKEWLEEFGLAITAEEAAVKPEPTPTTPSRRDAASSQCLLEGAVAALELFDIQRNHPFVVPVLASAKPRSGATPSPFPPNKQLSTTSGLTPQQRPSPLLSALHLTPSAAHRGRRSGQADALDSDKTDTYLIVFAGKDPLYTDGFDPALLKPPVVDSSRLSKLNTLKDPTSDVLTGLPSPTPSPEDKHSKARSDPSPKSSSRQVVMENKNRIYDGFGWNQVLEEVCRRGIAFGWVHLASQGTATSEKIQDGILAKFFQALRKRPQAKNRREYLEEGPWWQAKDGEKAMFKGLNAPRIKKLDVEMKITVEAEKNANGTCVGRCPVPVLTAHTQASDHIQWALLRWSRIWPTKRNGSRPKQRQRLLRE